ncbi:hypothetical protein H696_05077 [Fonticula alba]|uniref:Secreted protein n=1 Tax=Fonticula alba TaxID=691883 RepID=A0A058Z2J4_FONAL|nr:hypothetical protein H696_05077 [Fonticula alba]KCV68158.1 hypothetical protein H696_05077 [Fonticula alba]|eukprot:XP_009497212.1 hypothetical protein H696_05077 [Fonticula alba]
MGRAFVLSMTRLWALLPFGPANRPRLPSGLSSPVEKEALSRSARSPSSGGRVGQVSTLEGPEWRPKKPEVMARIRARAGEKERAREGNGDTKKAMPRATLRSGEGAASPRGASKIARAAWARWSRLMFRATPMYGCISSSGTARPCRMTVPRLRGKWGMPSGGHAGACRRASKGASPRTRHPR